MRTKATRKEWDRLRKTGKGLAQTETPTVTLWPNGQREVWVKSADGRLGFSVQFSEGTHGLSARLYFFGGALDVTPDVAVSHYGRHMEVTQYRDTPEAKAFKRWYAHEETEEDITLLGPTYRRKEGI